jgi:hypothetical protein
MREAGSARSPAWKERTNEERGRGGQELRDRKGATGRPPPLPSLLRPIPPPSGPLLAAAAPPPPPPLLICLFCSSNLLYVLSLPLAPSLPPCRVAALLSSLCKGTGGEGGSATSKRVHIRETRSRRQDDWRRSGCEREGQKQADTRGRGREGGAEGQREDSGAAAAPEPHKDGGGVLLEGPRVAALAQPVDDLLGLPAAVHQRLYGALRVKERVWEGKGEEKKRRGKQRKRG